MFLDLLDFAGKPKFIEGSGEFSRHLGAEDHELSNVQVVILSVKTSFCLWNLTDAFYDPYQLLSVKETIYFDTDFEIVTISVHLRCENVQLAKFCFDTLLVRVTFYEK